MSSEEKNSEQQSTLFSCSVHSHSCTLMPLSEKAGNIKLSSSEPGCYCIKARIECPKLCKKCGTKLTDHKPVSLTVALCESEDETLPSPTVSEEERNHEYKCSDTPDNSQDVPSDKDSKSSKSCSASCTGACSSLSSVTPQKPVYIDPRLKDHVPKSIEELKASISGLTGEEKSPVGNLLGCEFIDFCCEIRTSGSDCEPEDSEPCCSDRPVKQGISLTMEPNDHRFCTNPNDCKHTRPPPCPPKEPPCPPKEPPCPPKEPPCPPKEPKCPPEEPPCLIPQSPSCDSVE